MALKKKCHLGLEKLLPKSHLVDAYCDMFSIHYSVCSLYIGKELFFPLGVFIRSIEVFG